MTKYLYTLYGQDTTNGRKDYNTAHTLEDAQELLAKTKKDCEERVAEARDMYEETREEHDTPEPKDIYVSDKICTTDSELDQELDIDGDECDEAWAILREED